MAWKMYPLSNCGYFRYLCQILVVYLFINMPCISQLQSPPLTQPNPQESFWSNFPIIPNLKWIPSLNHQFGVIIKHHFLSSHDLKEGSLNDTGTQTSLSHWTLQKKGLNSIFPTKYVIPKSLKFSHWPSKKQCTIFGGKSHKFLFKSQELDHPKKWVPI